MNNSKLSNINQTSEDLLPNEHYVLDAPGINGMGADWAEKLTAHIENGGKLLHKVLLADDGTIQFCDPQGMWPNPKADKD
jgi:hypothetical protein